MKCYHMILHFSDSFLPLVKLDEYKIVLCRTASINNQKGPYLCFKRQPHPMFVACTVAWIFIYCSSNHQGTCTQVQALAERHTKFPKAWDMKIMTQKYHTLQELTNLHIDPSHSKQLPQSRLYNQVIKLKQSLETLEPTLRHSGMWFWEFVT